MKYKRLIYAQTSTDVEVYLDMVGVINKSQEANISDVLEISL